MPTFKPAKSARIPIISGKTAPPIIPETNIPEKAPWSFGTEFKAREIIIDHIVDIKKPINGNENKETFKGPKSDIKREMIEADVKKILIVGGAGKEQFGPFPDTISLLETGIFDKYGISEIGIAGHPEGSPDITDKEIKKALLLKNKFSETSNAKFFIVSQFCFDADTILNWSKKINSEGNNLK